MIFAKAFKKSKSLCFQPKLVALPKNDTPTNGHLASTNDIPSRAAAEWMEATKGDLVFNSLIQKSLEGSGSNSLYLDTILKLKINSWSIAKQTFISEKAIQKESKT